MSTPKTASDLSSEDFELFWEWLTFKKGSTVSAKRADNIKIIRVFDTLDMFNSNADAVEFVKSWDCDNKHTVMAYELRVGLLRLAPSQFQKFYRFVAALQVKDRQDREKAKKREEQEQIAREKVLRKGSQYERARRARKQKHAGRSLAPNPAILPVEEDETSDVKSSGSKIRSFKEKHGLQQKSSGSMGKFLSFVRTFSERSMEALSSPLKKATSSASDSSNDTITAMERAISTDSEDSFTTRLSKANLSIFQEDICGNDAMSSYRQFDIPSDIVESLESFGSVYHSSGANESMEIYEL